MRLIDCNKLLYSGLVLPFLLYLEMNIECQTMLAEEKMLWKDKKTV